MRAWATLAIATLLVLPGAAGLTAGLADDDPTTVTAPGSDAPWARQLVQDLDRATTVNDQDGDKLFDSLEDAYVAAPTQALDVVVVFTDETPTEDGLARARQAAGAFPIHATFEIIPGLAARLTLEQATRIAQLEVTRQIELDHEGTLELDTATAIMGADHVVDDLGITGDLDGDEMNYTPEDATIAVLDTGFDGDHVDLDDGKIIAFHDVANGEEEPYDPHYHGTHVASIAAGTGDGQAEHRGVAPGAGIVGIKITDNDGERSSYSLAIEGYEWIVENRVRLGIDVSTISFGFGTATDGTTALELAIDEVWEAGVVNFKSTGNGGPERRTITVPAASRGILATGAMLDPNGASGNGLAGTGIDASWGFQLATFSSRGPTTDGRIKPDITAPGVSITAAEAGTEDGYVALSGTSMAAPFAAGTAALVLTANPGLTPDDVRDILTSTTEDWGLQGDDVDYGWGRLQVAQAVGHAAARGGHALNVTSPVVPFHEVASGIVASAVDTDPGTAVATETLEVESTEMPFAVTAIVEGTLVELVVEDPSGDIVASFQPTDQASRQHVVGFEADETGPHTVRLVAQPQASYVIDVSHGTAGGISVDLPEVPLETLESQSEDTSGVPLGLGPLLVAGLIAWAGARRRAR